MAPHDNESKGLQLTIKRIRELDKIATPPPWVTSYGILPAGPPVSVESHHGRICGMYAAGRADKYDVEMTTANTDLISESRMAVRVLCDALEKAIKTLGYYAHPEHYEESAMLGGTGFRKPGVLTERGDMASALLQEWGVE